MDAAGGKPTNFTEPKITRLLRRFSVGLVKLYETGIIVRDRD